MKDNNLNKILNTIKQLYLFTMTFCYSQPTMYVENYIRVVFSLVDVNKSHIILEDVGGGGILYVLSLLTGDEVAKPLADLLQRVAPLFWAFSFLHLASYFICMFVGLVIRQIPTLITILILLIFALLVVDVKLMELMTFFAILNRENYNFLESVILHAIENCDMVIITFSFLVVMYYKRKVENNPLHSNKIISVVKQLYTFISTYWHSYVIMYVNNYLRVLFSLDIDKSAQPQYSNSTLAVLSRFTDDEFMSSLEQVLLEFAPLFWAFSIIYLVIYFVFLIAGYIPKQIFTFITILLLLIFALLVVDVKLMELMTFFAILNREECNFLESVIFNVFKNYSIVVLTLLFLLLRYYYKYLTNKKLKKKWEI